MSPIRIIGGVAKGRRLRMVPGSGTRPVGDRVKEALFNILGPDVEGSHFLDLFAGTGSVGIEALSRGAERVVLVEKGARACKTIRANLEHVGLMTGAVLIQADVFHTLNGDPDGSFDYVYIAPPQSRGLWSRALMQMDRRTDWLNPDAWVIAQIHPKEYEDLALASLELFDQRAYGKTMLVFYEHPGR